MIICRFLIPTLALLFFLVSNMFFSSQAWSPFSSSVKLKKEGSDSAMKQLNQIKLRIRKSRNKNKELRKLKQICKKDCTTFKCKLNKDLAKCCVQNCPTETVKYCSGWSKVKKSSLNKSINYCVFSPAEAEEEEEPEYDEEDKNEGNENEEDENEWNENEEKYDEDGEEGEYGEYEEDMEG